MYTAFFQQKGQGFQHHSMFYLMTSLSIIRYIYVTNDVHVVDMLQINLLLRSICFQPRSVCSNLGQFVSNLGQFVPTQVNVFQPRSIWSNLGQFDFFFAFAFGTFDLLFILLLVFISTLLTSPTIPPLLTQHRKLYSFYLNAYLGNHRPLVFLWIHVLMPYLLAMQTWMQVTLFF